MYFILYALLPKKLYFNDRDFFLMLAFTMCKDGLENYKRYKQDKLSNSRSVNKFINKKWIKDECYKIIPGNIIKIFEDEECCSDILIIKYSISSGCVYVDTKNLDGETNLKEKSVIQKLKDEKIGKNELFSLSGRIITIPSNENLN